MNLLSIGVFDLRGNLAAKADSRLIADDVQQFAAIGHCLEQSIAELSERLDDERNARSSGATEAAMERDQAIHRLTARRRALRRFGLDLCLGRIVSSDDPAPLYIGRLDLTDLTGRRLLVDWRSPTAEPFFGATHANPMGLTSRRRYRWTRGRISNYWDEVFSTDRFTEHAVALDDQSAFIASLGSRRTPRMRDVLTTIQADQDAIIRAGSRGALVVDGGPGTGKTVVALHRTAYLLYSDPRLGDRRGGVLFNGFAESWRERLNRVGLDRIGVASLSINHRTPRENMVEAEPVIRAVLPDANVPTSIRSTGIPVVHGSVDQLSSVIQTWLFGRNDGTACVISTEAVADVRLGSLIIDTPRVRSLTPELAKGLEFDLVVVIDPEGFGPGLEGAVDRYVAMTRATQQLVMLGD